MIQRLATAVVVGWVALALGADLLASDLPLAVRVDGVVHLLPALTRPAALHGQSQQTLRSRAEWMIGTPIPFGPLQTVASANETRPEPPPWAPDGTHLMGTDDIGRDVAARLIHGSRLTLLIALGVVLLSTLLGVALGGLAGWKGGVTDLLLSRLLEVAITFPTVFVLIVIVAALRGPSVLAVIVVLGFTRWPEAARLTRAEVLKVKRQDFVAAARALGAGPWWLLSRHVIPNALRPVVVSSTFAVGAAVLLEASLSFLGLGAPPPTSSWGELLQQAHRNLVQAGAWWLALFPGLAIASLVLATQAVGKGLERRFDARR